MQIRVSVIGAGSWGTTVAHLAAHNAPTILWARRAEAAHEINTRHRNVDYLPDYDEHRFVTHVANQTVFGTSLLDKLASFTYAYDLAGNRTKNVGGRSWWQFPGYEDDFSKSQKIDPYTGCVTV